MRLAFFITVLFASNISFSQKNAVSVESFNFDSLGIKLYDLFISKEGVAHFTTSVGIWKMWGHQLDGPAVGYGDLEDNKGKPNKPEFKVRSYLAEDSIRSMAQGPDSTFYFVAHDNSFLWRPNGFEGGWGWPQFNFPKASPILKIWVDEQGNIFAGTKQDNFYIIDTCLKKNFHLQKSDIGFDKDSNYTVIKTDIKIRHIVLQPGIGVYSFTNDASDQNIVWIGTNNSLFTYNKKTKEVKAIEGVNKSKVTITEIYTGEEGNIWFSTLEKGMGVYNVKHQTFQFYPYKIFKSKLSGTSSVRTFCYKSPYQFFVAAMDSLPAIFNTVSRKYLFLDDSVFHESPNQTTEVKIDKLGNLLLFKGGRFYILPVSKNDFLQGAIKPDSNLMAPFFRGIQMKNGVDLATLDYKPELLKEITLSHSQNSILVYYDVNDFSDKKDIQFAWKLNNITGWVETPSFNVDSGQVAYLQDLQPGNYLLQLKVRISKGEWRKQIAEMRIIITPPFWRTLWFWAVIIFLLLITIYLIIHLRIKTVRKQERARSLHQKELMELEAKALRAQMNPHFIFNCLNSIKSLIQEGNEEKSVIYLTTFSKLIRTLFNNADKKEITLYDEIETCKLYLQLEAMRFDAKFSYSVNVDQSIDLKSISIPALVIQPFIENAIWHGVVPREANGYVNLSVVQNNATIEIIVDDNGIGREASNQNKETSRVGHRSKGVNLTQSRLKLDNLLRHRDAKLETIDKKDEQGNAMGTKVIITIKEELS